MSWTRKDAQKDLEIIILNEVIQTERQISYAITHVESSFIKLYK